MVDIFIAADKPWHKRLFLEYKPADDNNWTFIDNEKDLKEKLKSITPRYIFFLHWSKNVPEYIWSSIECVCFHMTDLPFGRGGSPLQNLILRGFNKTKISAFRMQKEVDAGPIYIKKELPLNGSASEIYIRATKVSWEIIKWITQDYPTPQEQRGLVTYFKRRNPRESEIPLLKNAENVYDFIRMLDAPDYPKAYIRHGAIILEFSEAKFSNGRVEAKVLIYPKDNNEK